MSELKDWLKNNPEIEVDYNFSHPEIKKNEGFLPGYVSREQLPFDHKDEGLGYAEDFNVSREPIYTAMLDRERPEKFGSKTEKIAWDHWEHWINQLDGILSPVPIIEFRYEAFSFKLPGGVSYTADFYIMDNDGRLHIVEVKGGKAFRNFHQSARDAVARIKICADLNWRLAKFYVLTPNKNSESGWHCELVRPGMKGMRFSLEQKK